MRIIFDFDGVIANTNNLVADYLQYHYGIKATHLRKHGIVAILQKYKIPRWQIAVGTYFLRRAIKNHLWHVKPFPGMKPLLQRLAKHHELIIVSSNSRGSIRSFLKREKIEYFTHIHKSSLLGKERILKKFHDSIYIGDEDRDILAAKAANIPIIAVTWGYNEKSLLKKHKPEFLVDKPADIERIIQQASR